MKIHCHRCGIILGLWKLRCPYCFQSAVSWLHILVITVVSVTAVFYLLRSF